MRDLCGSVLGDEHMFEDFGIWNSLGISGRGSAH